MSRFRIWVKYSSFVMICIMLAWLCGQESHSISEEKAPASSKAAADTDRQTGGEAKRAVSTEAKINIADTRSMLLARDEEAGADIFSLEWPEDEAVSLPAGLKMNLQYHEHPLPYQYVLSNKASVNIRDAPQTEGKPLRQAAAYERFVYLETVQKLTQEGQPGEKWTHVSWEENGQKKFGFIRADLTLLRTFRFATMYAQVLREEKEFEGKISYINNYKDMTGAAPAYQGGDTDSYGNLREQAAPGYQSPSLASDFRYIDDGTLVTILEKKGGLYHVKVHGTGITYTCWVPEKYIPAWKSIGPLRKVIVIDLKNQNEALFEKRKNGWAIVSFSLATTGAKAQYKAETPPGSYFIIEKRDKFDYLDDITREVTGYAPYAVRFTGGAYIHGVPVSYEFRDGKRLNPGMKEESPTLGTVPLSHKCVRNYTSHAKFISEWTEIGNTAVIVIQ